MPPLASRVLRVSHVLPALPALPASHVSPASLVSPPLPVLPTSLASLPFPISLRAPCAPWRAPPSPPAGAASRPRTKHCACREPPPAQLRAIVPGWPDSPESRHPA